jgi:hypothetical protein
MMSAYGEFPDSGNYGACNSFPRNTAVEVVNLENGKTVTVIITKGSDNPGFFCCCRRKPRRVSQWIPESSRGFGFPLPGTSRRRLTPSSPTTDPDFNPSLLAAKRRNPLRFLRTAK